MKNLFIEYPKCSTCQKAKKWLESHNIEFIDRHIVENNPTEEELSKWIKQSNKDIKKWFNTSGMKYKELNLKDKLINMSEEDKIKLLASDGMLVKRPILVTEKDILIGFREAEWEERLMGWQIHITMVKYNIEVKLKVLTINDTYSNIYMCKGICTLNYIISK